MTKQKTVAECEAELTKAREAYDRAHDDASAASRRETEAINRLSDAQKAFDAAVESVKKNSPWNSHWHQEFKHKSSMSRTPMEMKIGVGDVE